MIAVLHSSVSNFPCGSMRLALRLHRLQLRSRTSQFLQTCQAIGQLQATRSLVPGIR